MADSVPETPPPASGGKPTIAGSIIGLVLASTALVAPLTMQSEGTVYKAYLDPVGIPTICNGHTAGVKQGDVATPEQCHTYMLEDMKEHVNTSLRVTPTLSEDSNALAAAGDFSYNTGDGPYLSSPMRSHFLKKDWVGGCLAFLGYYDSGTFSKPQPKMVCKPKTDTQGRLIRGKWLCKLGGLVTRRVHEKQLCLTGKWG